LAWKCGGKWSLEKNQASMPAIAKHSNFAIRHASEGTRIGTLFNK
jgi:predicted metalloprotease